MNRIASLPLRARAAASARPRCSFSVRRFGRSVSVSNAAMRTIWPLRRETDPASSVVRTSKCDRISATIRIATVKSATVAASQRRSMPVAAPQVEPGAKIAAA